jgi:hypothetical protein
METSGCCGTIDGFTEKSWAEVKGMLQGMGIDYWLTKAQEMRAGCARHYHASRIA